MTVKIGDKIKLHYTGSLENGKVFDTTEGKDPIEFEVGAKQVMPAIDEAVVGMEADTEKEITITQAFGPVNDKLQQSMPIDFIKKQGK